MTLGRVPPSALLWGVPVLVLLLILLFFLLLLVVVLLLAGLFVLVGLSSERRAWTGVYAGAGGQHDTRHLEHLLSDIGVIGDTRHGAVFMMLASGEWMIRLEGMS